MTWRARLLLALMRVDEWVGPGPVGMAPGRRVYVDVGRLRIERLWGGFPDDATIPGVFITGARMRAAGWTMAHPEALRGEVRWPYGALALVDRTLLPVEEPAAR